MKRTRDVAGRSVLLAAAVAVGLTLTGCSELSPRLVAQYPAADGVNLNLPGSQVELRDFVVIGTAKGAPATVLGSVVNNGPAAIQVSLQSDVGTGAQAAETKVTVPSQGVVELGPNETQTMSIASLAVEPGAVTAISAATVQGGTADVDVPVLPPQGPYASLTPAPVASATPSVTATPLKGSKKKTKKQSSSSSSTPTPTTTPTTN